jgi:hypothetical protein
MNMKNRLSAGGMGLVGALLLLLVTALPASAHEVRQVGPYTFVVGFLNEPAYAGQQNSLDLTICNGKQCQYTVQDGLRVVANPVTNADQTLKAEVITGSAAPLSLPLEPRYANPGKYASYFVPSKVGTYTFHIFGMVNGMKIDEKFTSSPNTFSDAEQIHVYPPVASQTPDAGASQAQVQEAQHSANTAATLGFVGVIVGVLGLAAAGLALTRKPRLSAEGRSADKSSVESLRG